MIEKHPPPKEKKSYRDSIEGQKFRIRHADTFATERCYRRWKFINCSVTLWSFSSWLLGCYVVWLSFIYILTTLYRYTIIRFGDTIVEPSLGKIYEYFKLKHYNLKFSYSKGYFFKKLYLKRNTDLKNTLLKKWVEMYFSIKIISGTCFLVCRTYDHNSENIIIICCNG